MERLIFLRRESLERALERPERHWRELLADLRYLGNVAYPRLLSGKPWGDWTLSEVERTFARIVDALRSIGFPFIPPEDERKHSSYWELYRRCERKGLLRTKPPAKGELRAWVEKRRRLIS